MRCHDALESLPSFAVDQDFPERRAHSLRLSSARGMTVEFTVTISSGFRLQASGMVLFLWLRLAVRLQVFTLQASGMGLFDTRVNAEALTTVSSVIRHQTHIFLQSSPTHLSSVRHRNMCVCIRACNHIHTPDTCYSCMHACTQSG
jgi:hypothetical protein